jgi:hypothetical protein
MFVVYGSHSILLEYVELLGLELTHGSGVRLNHVNTPLATSARSDPERPMKAGRRGEQRATAGGIARHAVPADCIRPDCPLTPQDAQRIVSKFVED